MKAIATAITALLLAGCDFSGAQGPEQNESRLLRGCGETTRLLDQMKAAESSFTYDQSGNARMPKELWSSIPTNMQETLINAIAYQAVCASGELDDQVVTIRSSDGSEVLAQQTVTEFSQ
ncbi:MAG: hypothetical protein M3177_03030 [Pseudomonadota bacterium]|nr:hypothetical protein [Pseudomonadota bacterium]